MLETLENKVTNLDSILTEMDFRHDNAEQYSLRNCLRQSSIQEAHDENFDDIVLNFMESIVIGRVHLTDIDRIHRLGKWPSDLPSSEELNKMMQASPGRPRDIIITFSTYRARQFVFKNKSKLKTCGYMKCFLNEDLTRTRGTISYLARQLVKSKSIYATWTTDGVTR